MRAGRRAVDVLAIDVRAGVAAGETASGGAANGFVVMLDVFGLPVAGRCVAERWNGDRNTGGAAVFSNGLPRAGPPTVSEVDAPGFDVLTFDIPAFAAGELVVVA